MAWSGDYPGPRIATTEVIFLVFIVLKIRIL